MSMTEGTASSKVRASLGLHQVSLFLVLLLAAVLRLYGLVWHLRIVRHPDESRLIYMTLSLGAGSLTPPELIYGSLTPYVLASL